MNGFRYGLKAVQSKGFKLALVSLFLAQLSLQAGLCQVPNPQTDKQKGQLDPNKLNKKPAYQPTGESLAKPPDNLKDKVNLDGVPEYTGKARFLNGLVYDRVGKQGANYVMTFNVKETKDQVKDWYQSVFQMYNWKINYKDQDSIMATNKDGNNCIVQIAEPVAGYSNKDERSSYTIRYQYAKAH